MVIRIEIGMAVREMKVARALSRNTNRMTATTTAASISTCLTFRIDVSMKVACLNWTFVTVIPDDMVRCSD